MHLRRTLALATTSFLLVLLSGCGLNFATDMPYTPAAGTYNQDGSVDVLNAVIVATEDGSGTFIAALANNDGEESATFEALEGIDQAQLTAELASPIEIPADGLVNLAEEGGVEVTGEFALGDFVPVSVQFGNGERVELDVPVVTNCGDFAGLDGPSDEEACAPPEPATEEH